MPQKFRAILIGALTLLALCAVAASAAATSITLTSATGNYTATTTANQTLTAPTPFGTLTISCSQTAVLNVPSAGPIGVPGGTLGSLTGASTTFACGPGASARVLNNPPIVMNALSSSTVALATIRGVQVSVTTALGTCLFQGDIGFSVTNNSTTGALLGGSLTPVSGICNGPGTISATGYRVTPPAPSTVISWTLVP